MGENVYILADMHTKPLDAPNAAAREAAVRDNERLARFLQSIQGKADTLILLGDAFNFWFERKGKVAGDYYTTLNLLKLASDNGLDIHQVSGNRDFVVGEGLGFDSTTRYPGFLRQKSGFTVSRLADYGIEPHGPRYRFHQSGKTIMCVHGDGLCTRDRLFTLFRWLLLGPVGRWTIRLAPWSVWEAIVPGLQGRMGIRNKRADPGKLISPEMARKEVAVGADMVLCGHIHAYHHMAVQVVDRQGELVALPAWLDGYYGRLSGGKLEILRFE